MENKCPICGAGFEEPIENEPYFKCYGNNCWFRCSTKDLHRIAAAMKLARSLANGDDCTEWDRKSALDDYYTAFRR
jgi:hypothetical protein